jgi:hypothetical protein
MSKAEPLDEDLRREVEKEIEQDDHTVIPADLSDMSPWITGYRFSYWRTKYEDRYLELVSRGHTGEDRWALLDSPYCYNKRTRQFEYEMRNSERSDEFLRDCRMTLDEARKVIPQLLYGLHHHAFRKVVRIVTLQRMRETEKKSEESDEQ